MGQNTFTQHINTMFENIWFTHEDVRGRTCCVHRRRQKNEHQDLQRTHQHRPITMLRTPRPTTIVSINHNTKWVFLGQSWQNKTKKMPMLLLERNLILSNIVFPLFHSSRQSYRLNVNLILPQLYLIVSVPFLFI